MKYEYKIQTRDDGKNWRMLYHIYTSLFAVREAVDNYIKIDRKVGDKADYRIVCRRVPDWDFLEEYKYEEEM